MGPVMMLCIPPSIKGKGAQAAFRFLFRDSGRLEVSDKPVLPLAAAARRWVNRISIFIRQCFLTAIGASRQEMRALDGGA
jgi:hypothetical protein